MVSRDMYGMDRRQRKVDEQAGFGNVDIGEIIGKLSREQMIDLVARFLDEIGYENVPVSQVGSVIPDFHWRRTEGGITYDLLGVLAMAPDEVFGCYEKLAEMQDVMGEKVDYTVAIHQMPEYLLYDMLETNKGKLYIDMKDREFMMWVCYSTEEGDGVWCFLGGSRDKMLEAYFTNVRQLTAESIVGPRVADILMEEEMEDF